MDVQSIVGFQLAEIISKTDNVLIKRIDVSLSGLITSVRSYRKQIDSDKLDELNFFGFYLVKWMIKSNS